MKALDIVFTVNQAGANYSAKLCYTCKTAYELEGAKSSISDYLSRKIQQMVETEKQEANHDD